MKAKNVMPFRHYNDLIKRIPELRYKMYEIEKEYQILFTTNYNVNNEHDYSIDSCDLIAPNAKYYKKDELVIVSHKLAKIEKQRKIENSSNNDRYLDSGVCGKILFHKPNKNGYVKVQFGKEHFRLIHISGLGLMRLEDGEQIKLREDKHNVNKVKFIEYVYDNNKIPNNINLSNDDLFLIEIGVYDKFRREFIQHKIVKQSEIKRIKLPLFEEDYNQLNLERINSIYKIGRNERIHYGDGGENDMKWNIYVSDKLKTVNNSIISKLRTELIELGQTNNDWRDGEPIQNIIDPDLYIYKFYDKTKRNDYLLDEYKEQFDEDRETDYDYFDQRLQNDPNDDWANKAHPKIIWKKLQENDEKGFFIRRKYQWLSTQCVEDKNTQKIEICSPIHNISPRSKYSSIYTGIEDI
eukprot:178176_1